MTDKSELTYIELFGGCGGMSLGLESAGFQRILGNEVSPMAAETFAFNLVPGSRSAAPPEPDSPSSWEPHFTFLDPPGNGEGVPDDKTFRDWHGHVRSDRHFPKAVNEALMGNSRSNLLVGDAGRFAMALEAFKQKHPLDFNRRFGAIDLVAGGPPCQSFSLAGRRDRNHPRNRLFEAFVSIVQLVRPKVVLFENVLGITRPFVDEAGDDWHPWHEVCRAFYNAGYLPIPSLVNASDYGVPQSRPRFIMIALKQELASKLLNSPLKSPGLAEALHRARTCYREPSKDRDLIFRLDREYTDIGWPAPLFPLPTTLGVGEKIGVGIAIEDLLSLEHGGMFIRGTYAESLRKRLKRPLGISSHAPPLNHGLRNHSPRTQARFRLMRTLALSGFMAKSIREVAKQRERAIGLLVNKPLLVPHPNGEYIERKRATTYEVVQLLESLSSAKNVQKCLDPRKPAPAQLSIPDDSIHWNSDRVLTIREMARIQSFPDWFEFRSKETTGGSARSYEVPQYTQVANAVPPLLALAFGESIMRFLKRLRQVHECRQDVRLQPSLDDCRD